MAGFIEIPAEHDNAAKSFQNVPRPWALYAGRKEQTMLMMDKNGIEIKTGDIVRVTGAYFKQDNRVYYVDRSPGDASWCGTDYSLHALNSVTGELSQTKYKVAFWPLSSFVSDHLKNIEAQEWNKEHAQIEVIYTVNVHHVYDFFVHEAEEGEQSAERMRYRYPDSEVERQIQIAAFNRSVAERIRKNCIERNGKWFPLPGSAPVPPMGLEAFAQRYAQAVD